MISFKKAILSLIVLAAALLVAAPAKAQYYGSEACNRTFSDGFNGYTGSGPNGEFVVRFYITTHYQAKNIEVVKEKLAEMMVDEMNIQSAKEGHNARFLATSYANPTNLNFTVYIDMYDPNDVYSAYFYVNGWGAGHLFQFHTTGSEGGPVLLAGADGISDRWSNGWICGN